MSGSLFEQYKAALRRGHMAALAGQLEDALAAYDEAARLVPERALPLASRGTVLHRLDRWPEAAEAFDQALRLAPDDEAALRARATARAERGLRSGAATDFERLAFVLDVSGRSADAADAARRAADLEPSSSREALADRLGAAAAQLADLVPRAAPAGASTASAPEPSPADAQGGGAPAADPRNGHLDAVAESPPEPQRPVPAADEAANDALETDPTPGATAGEAGDAAASGDAAATDAASGVVGAEPAAPEAGGQAWPPIEGPPPDPEELLAEAALVLESRELEAARDLMLRAAQVHRQAGRIDAALEICLNLLSIAPGDPRVHLAIANLQLDRGWTPVATEKLELLVRLTSLTGDTQAEADVHGLAAERLRDEPTASPTGG